MLKNKFIMKKNGYVLLELVISLAIFSLIILVVLVIVFDLSMSSNKLTREKNSLDNIRLIENFLQEQLRRAEKIELVIDNSSSMKKIKIYDDKKDENSNPEHEFYFNPTQKIIKFGDNRLAESISNVKLNYLPEIKLLGIKISADKFKELNFVLCLKYKEVVLKKFD